MSVKNSTTQLSLFGDQPNSEDCFSKVPLPIQVAKKFGFPLSYITHRKREYYNVRQWVDGCIGGATDLTIRQLRNKGVISNNALMIDEKSDSGQTVKTEYVLDVVLYRITQEFRSTEKRPLVKAIKEFLAQAGAFVDAARLEAARLGTTPRQYIKDKLKQGYSQDDIMLQIADRVDAAVSRTDLTDVLRNVVSGAIIYGDFTNIEYQGLFSRTAKQIKAETGASSARNGLTPAGLGLVRTAEIACTEMLRGRDSVSFEEACRIMGMITNDLRPSVLALNRRLGLDIATGIPLLTGGTR